MHRRGAHNRFAFLFAVYCCLLLGAASAHESVPQCNDDRACMQSLLLESLEALTVVSTCFQGRARCQTNRKLQVSKRRRSWWIA